MNQPTVFRELDPDMLPMTVEMIDQDTGELLYAAEITGAGALQIPGFRPRKVMVRTVTPTQITVADNQGVVLHVEMR